jgi:hypothetical protein
MASPEQYNLFIQQIDLDSVWLADAKITNGIGADAPDRTDVTVDRDSSWGPIGGGFLALDTYKIVLGPTVDPAATIEVTFGLKYRSKLGMTDALFEPFKQFNLSLNAWPYAREFVASTTARMNWIPFTLPALRLGAISPADEQSASAHAEAVLNKSRTVVPRAQRDRGVAAPARERIRRSREKNID